MTDVFKTNATGAAAIAASDTVPSDWPSLYKLVSVTLSLNVAPTTSENYTITLNANAGAAYDVLLYSLDLSAVSVTDLVWFPDAPLLLEAGDAIDVAYANTDTKTYGVQITMEAV